MSDHTVRDRRPIAPLRLDKEPHIPFVTKKKNTTPFSTLYNSCRCGGEHRELIFFDKMFVTLGSLHELRNVGYTLRGGDFLQEGKSPTAIYHCCSWWCRCYFPFHFLVSDSDIWSFIIHFILSMVIYSWYLYIHRFFFLINGPDFWHFWKHCGLFYLIFSYRQNKEKLKINNWPNGKTKNRNSKKTKQIKTKIKVFP